MKLTGISFSLSEDSMNYRGLSLMKHWLDMEIKSIADFNIPLLNKNVSDGIVPKDTPSFKNKLESELLSGVSDALPVE